MKFKIKRTWRKTVIIAEAEHPDEYRGTRAQAPYKDIRLTGNKAVFNYRVKDIHPDLLALLCMVMFYPFCKKTVTFPKPVSRQFQKAFGTDILPVYEVAGGSYVPVRTLEITNVDPNLEPYSGEKLSLSYGGGFDSLAVHLLFPEAVVIHERPRMKDGSIKKDGATAFLKRLKKKGYQVFDIVNNQRYGLNSPGDWSTWPACAANAILLATDLGIGYIMTGTTIDSKFLDHHGAYLPAIRPENFNPWNKAFDTIGLKLFSPVWGVSEPSTIKIVADNGLYDDAIFCTRKNGYPCHQCFKCFRKDTYASAVKARSFDDEYWERYNYDKLKAKLYEKPVHAANGISYGLRHLSHIDWINEAVKDLPDTSHWMRKYYREAFRIMPPELVPTIEERLKRYMDPVEDPSDIENWDALRNLKQDH